MTESILILGGGYVGKQLAEKLSAPCTHRTAEKCLANDIYFDLADRPTWKNIPHTDIIIWTFTATPLEEVKAFYKEILSHCSKLIVYASSSCYTVQEDDEFVTESSPLDLSRERVAAEEWLREQGAIVLVLSGIYGPNREPKSWLECGRITTPDKRVNLIHVDDIVNITEQVIHSNKNIRSERFNLCDGESLFWKTIAAHYQLKITSEDKPYKNKRVSNRKITDWLDDYRFRSLFEEYPE